MTIETMINLAIAAVVAAIVGVVDVLLLSIGAKTAGPASASSSAWYD